jgi:hypothetical protein
VRQSRYAKNKTVLHQRLRISRPALDRLFRRPDHPIQVPGKGWDVAEWERYRDRYFAVWNQRLTNHSNGNGSSPNAREQSIIERNRIATQREKFRLEVEMSEYVPRVEANRQIEASNYVVRRELHKALVMELPARLEMLKAAEIRKVIQAKYDEIVSHLPGLILNALNGTRTNES